METCKSGSEGGCRKPVAYAIRRLCPTGEPDTWRRVSPVPREGVGNLLLMQ